LIGLIVRLITNLIYWPIIALIFGLSFGLNYGLSIKQTDQITYPGQKLVFTVKNSLFVLSGVGLSFGLSLWLIAASIDMQLTSGQIGVMIGGSMSLGLFLGIKYGGLFLIQHYALRFILTLNNLLPWRLVPFLDHCVDLIFLRRVGGGYIFVHRLLMEHFAAMYKEEENDQRIGSG
jgi:eukaryotic-like serine/threonine-protein kinase